MIFYAIRHKESGELMPEMERRGYSHWNPSKVSTDAIKSITGCPRLISTRGRAARCIAMWNANPNARFGPVNFGDYYSDDYGIIIKEDGRSKDDLEVVEIELEIRS